MAMNAGMEAAYDEVKNHLLERAQMHGLSIVTDKTAGQPFGSLLC